MKLLLAEDDAMLGTSMEKALTLAGFTVDWVRNGQHAITALQALVYDVVLLDIGLPEVDGLQVLQHMRQRRQATPVLMVTARDAIRDRVAGLNQGADDYLTKPFDLDELVARIHALARRQPGQANPTLQMGRLALSPIEREVRLGDKLLSLSQREFDLLQALMQKPGAVLSVEQLESKLYGWGEEISSNAIEVHLHHLRRKLGEPWIRNVRGVGYKLVEVA
ncbi:response regulator transcription factor [Hydrogenophaga sp. MI9]|uniref:response regulator transcription factor n=1 Tax=Hydrogenophaga sp. MI9 TaxID=3453719 RepID=UPI003EEB8853